MLHEIPDGTWQDSGTIAAGVIPPRLRRLFRKRGGPPLSASTSFTASHRLQALTSAPNLQLIW